MSEFSQKLEEKEEGLGQIMQKSDDLRLKKLKGVIDILSPIQGGWGTLGFMNEESTMILIIERID